MTDLPKTQNGTISGPESLTQKDQMDTKPVKISAQKWKAAAVKKGHSRVEPMNTPLPTTQQEKQPTVPPKPLFAAMAKVTDDATAKNKPPVPKDPYILYGDIRFNPNWVFNVRSNTYFIWLSVLSLSILYNLVMIVPRAVFEQLENDPRSYFLWLCLDYLTDTAYWLDMVVNLLTGHYDNGIIVREPRKLIKHYRSSWQLRWDLISVFPLDLLYFYTGRQVPMILLRLNRLLKLPRLSEFLYRAENRTENPAVFRTFCLFGELFIIVHLNGCVYYYFSSIIGIGSDRWVYPASAIWRENVTNNTDFVNDTMWQKWTVCTYWSAMMLTSIIPQMNNPTNDYEFIFHFTEMFLGIVLITSILGRISALLSDMDKKHDLFKGKRETVRLYIRSRKVGMDMEELVMRWFDYIWNTNQQLDEVSVLECLPEKIRMDIAKCIHFDILKKIHLFQDVPDQFLEQIGLKLKFEPFCPGGFVCRKGDIGREMYIIRRGRLQIMSDDCKTVLATLNPGAVFGELSILNIFGNKNENRRTTNVRALGYADLFSLSRKDLWDSLNDYPEAAVSMLEKATVLLKNLNIYSEDLANEMARKHRDYDKAVESLEIRWDSLIRNIEVFISNRIIRNKNVEKEVQMLEELMDDSVS